MSWPWEFVIILSFDLTFVLYVIKTIPYVSSRVNTYTTKNSNMFDIHVGISSGYLCGNLSSSDTRF